MPFIESAQQLEQPRVAWNSCCLSKSGASEKRNGDLISNHMPIITTFLSPKCDMHITYIARSNDKFQWPTWNGLVWSVSFIRTKLEFRQYTLSFFGDTHMIYWWLSLIMHLDWSRSQDLKTLIDRLLFQLQLDFFYTHESKFEFLTTCLRNSTSLGYEMN